jgi:hypothetical protein
LRFASNESDDMDGVPPCRASSQAHGRAGKRKVFAAG